MADFISHVPKDLALLLCRALGLLRIEHTPVKDVAGKRPQGKLFSRSIADRDDVRKVLRQRLLNVFGAVQICQFLLPA